jgi:ABC-type multidrug transport system fused ATPase/permease subunit
MLFEKIELEKDEAIITIVRRHWFYVFKQCFFIIVLMILPLLGLVLASAFSDRLIIDLLQNFLPHGIFLYAFWLLIQWMLLASVWTDHYLDVWTLTNRRIIKVDQVGLFRRQIGSFRLERLQDLNVEINGIIATLLDFGTIHAETASGSDEEFKAIYLPKPQEIKALILKAADAQMQRQTPSL